MTNEPQSAQPIPALQQLQPFVGEWRWEALMNGQSIGDGQATFEWIEGGAFLREVSRAEPPFPTNTIIIGADDTTGAYSMIYFDSRTVARLYQMSFNNRVWKAWRDAPGFNQRFTGTLSEDANSITGAWEKSEDGSQWEVDFEMTYTKLSV